MIQHLHEVGERAGLAGNAGTASLEFAETDLPENESTERGAGQIHRRVGLRIRAVAVDQGRVGQLE